MINVGRHLPLISAIEPENLGASVWKLKRNGLNFTGSKLPPKTYFDSLFGYNHLSRRIYIYTSVYIYIHIYIYTHTHTSVSSVQLLSRI